MDFCNWWWLAWLLPFLLGLLAGWLLWRKWKEKFEDMENTAAGLRKRITSLEEQLEECQSIRSRLKGDLSLAKGRYRELERKLEDYENNLNDDNQSNVVFDVDKDVKSSGIASSLIDGSDSGDLDNGDDNLGVASGIGDVDVTDKFIKVKNDNFQILEGIGPKMESVLKENGISNWAVLASKSNEDLQAILGKYGDKYRIIDPSDWPAQAALAQARDFDGLVAHQKADGSDSKAEKTFIKMGIIKAFKLDDLKAIEGIGPKIEGLLKDAGIDTWRELSQTSVERLKSVLEAAGSRYKLADPTTWPKQAEYAANGDWDALEKYQEFLDGGKI